MSIFSDLGITLLWIAILHWGSASASELIDERGQVSLLVGVVRCRLCI